MKRMVRIALFALCGLSLPAQTENDIDKIGSCGLANGRYWQITKKSDALIETHLKKEGLAPPIGSRFYFILGIGDGVIRSGGNSLFRLIPPKSTTLSELHENGR
jgi:hypothetical protein